MWLRWWRQSDPGEIRIRPDDFSLVRSGSLEFHIEWEAIRGIAAFNRVSFLSNRVCLAFLTDPDMAYQCVESTTPGFSALLKELRQQFGIKAENWWRGLAWGPAQSCWTALWGRAPHLTECPDCGYDLRGTRGLRCPECGQQFSRDTCPDCGGRGYFPIRFWPRASVIATVLGFAALLVEICFPWGPRWLRLAWLSVASSLALTGICVQFYVSMRNHICYRCRGSSILAQRGRS